MDELRLCTICHKKKKDLDFSRIAQTKNTGRCKTCQNAKNSERYHQNKERYLSTQKEHRAKNKEKFKERAKRYYAANKSACAERGRKYRAENKEAISATKTIYRENNKAKIVEGRKVFYRKNRERLLAEGREYRNANKEQIVAYRRKYRTSAKHKRRAQDMVQYNVKKGTITKEPCVACLVQDGVTNINVEGHHQDYDLPLNVIWLCKAHHREVHNSITI